MNKKEKEQWIIKYAKKNKIDYILNEKYNKKENKIKKYSNEIQSICSIISVLIIGGISLILTIHYNKMVNQQTKLMEYEHKPIIDIIINENISEGIDELTVINRGTPCRDYGVETRSYMDVMCHENGWGEIPIRSYVFGTFYNQGAVKDYHFIKDSSNEIAKLDVYTNSYHELSKLENDMFNIVLRYTTYFWEFNFINIIKVSYIDVLNNYDEEYFMYSDYGLRVMDKEFGKNIFKEWDDVLLNESDDFDINWNKSFNVNSNKVFKKILKRIRKKGLFSISSDTKEKTYYGKYEPKKYRKK